MSSDRTQASQVDLVGLVDVVIEIVGQTLMGQVTVVAMQVQGLRLELQRRLLFREDLPINLLGLEELDVCNLNELDVVGL